MDVKKCWLFKNCKIVQLMKIAHHFKWVYRKRCIKTKPTCGKSSSEHVCVYGRLTLTKWLTFRCVLFTFGGTSRFWRCTCVLYEYFLDITNFEIVSMHLRSSQLIMDKQVFLEKISCGYYWGVFSIVPKIPVVFLRFEVFFTFWSFIFSEILFV